MLKFRQFCRDLAFTVFFISLHFLVLHNKFTAPKFLLKDLGNIQPIGARGRKLKRRREKNVQSFLEINVNSFGIPKDILIRRK